MKHEQLQADFYRDFEGVNVKNWHINSDYIFDQIEVFRSKEELERASHAQAIRAQVWAARIAKENQQLAKQLGVTNDDTH